MSAIDGLLSNAPCTQPPNPAHAVVQLYPIGATIHFASVTDHGEKEGVTVDNGVPGTSVLAAVFAGLVVGALLRAAVPVRVPAGEPGGVVD